MNNILSNFCLAEKLNLFESILFSNDDIVNPCDNACGMNAKCTILHNRPICSCTPPLTGNPFEVCFEPSAKRSCIPEPDSCNSIEICREENGIASCQCRFGVNDHGYCLYNPDSKIEH